MDAPPEPPIELLKAIAHPHRYAILSSIAQGELNVGDIESATGIGQPTLSQQLSVLRNAGLVTARREAKLVFYAIAPMALEQICASFKALCPPALLDDLARRLAPGVQQGAPVPVPASGERDASIRRRGGAAVFARLD